MKRVSIVIVTYNSEADIFDCISSILRYADVPKDEIELIVVDNNSSSPQPMFDGIRDIWGDDVLLLKNTHNGGYGQGNNVGIRHSTSPIIMIMNPDVRIACPIFGKVLDAFDDTPSLSMYGMKQMNSKDCSSHNSFGCTYMMNGFLRTIFTGLCNKFECFIPRFMYLSGACFFIRKEMFMKVGLFDESNFMYGEEDDVHSRMTKAYGYKIIYDKSIHYLHLTKGRKMTVSKLVEHLEAAKKLNKKNGMHESETIRHFIEINITLCFIEKLKGLIGKCDGEQMNLLRGFRAELDKQLKKAKG